MSKCTEEQKNKSTKVHSSWPAEHGNNLIYLTASALSDSDRPSGAYYKEAIKFTGRIIKNRRRLGLCCAEQEQDLLAAIDILEPIGHSDLARKVADELSVNR